MYICMSENFTIKNIVASKFVQLIAGSMLPNYTNDYRTQFLLSILEFNQMCHYATENNRAIMAICWTVFVSADVLITWSTTTKARWLMVHIYWFTDDDIVSCCRPFFSVPIHCRSRIGPVAQINKTYMRYICCQDLSIRTNQRSESVIKQCTWCALSSQ